MGWTVLYIAFGVVALWLLGEVLLQYKARLRWRMLAFVGFLGVVLGVLIPSVVVIALGATGFALGQTCVTLSFRRGFSTGWALGGRPGSSKRRRTGGPPRQEPTLQVSGMESAGQAAEEAAGYAYAYPQPDEGPATTVYEPQPLPDDTGTYGVYSDAAYAASTATQGTSYGYDTYGGYDQQQYGFDPGQQQYAAYADPYAGSTQTYGDQAYDAYATQQGYAQDAYGDASYGGETPPGGVWMPQQRTFDPAYSGEQQPQEQPYPYQSGGYGTDYGTDYGAGYDGQQYRY